VHDCYSVDLVSQNVGKDAVVRRLEECLDDLLRSLGLDLLIDNSQHGQRSQLVRAQMGQVRGKSRREEHVSRGESGGIEQPGQQQGTVRVGGKWDRVENDRSTDSTLLVDGDVRAFQTSPHTTSTKAALSDLP